MTQETTAFRELFLPQTPAEFVPWPGMAGGPLPETGEFRPVIFVPDPVVEEGRRLAESIEIQRSEALSEIAREREALDARMAQLDHREEELARKQGEIESLQALVAEQAASLVAMADDFAEMKKARWVENADELVDFALELADKIVKERVRSDPTLLVSHLRAVLEELRVEEAVAVHMAPDDLVALQSADVAEIRALLEHPHITWLGDSRLGRGEIHVDTSQFRLDASVATALKNLRSDLTGKNADRDGHETEKKD